MKRSAFSLLFTFYVTLSTSAQCAMCRAVLESEEGQSTAQGINDGIVYLMIIPYILVASIGYLIYRTYNTKKTTKN